MTGPITIDSNELANVAGGAGIDFRAAHQAGKQQMPPGGLVGGGYGSMIGISMGGLLGGPVGGVLGAFAGMTVGAGAAYVAGAAHNIASQRRGGR